MFVRSVRSLIMALNLVPFDTAVCVVTGSARVSNVISVFKGKDYVCLKTDFNYPKDNECPVMTAEKLIEILKTKNENAIVYLSGLGPLHSLDHDLKNNMLILF